MKQIIAKQEYTDKFVSLYEGQIRNIENDLADRLIEKDIVAEHSEDSGSDIFVIHGEKESAATTFTIKQTFNECLQASKKGKALFIRLHTKSNYNDGDFQTFPAFLSCSYQNITGHRLYFDGANSIWEYKATIEKNGTTSYQQIEHKY